MYRMSQGAQTRSELLWRMPYVYIQSSLEGGNHKLIIAMVNNCLLCEAAFQLLETPLNAGFLLCACQTNKVVGSFSKSGIKKLPLLIKMKLASKQGNVWQGLIGQFGLLAAV